MEDIVSNGKNNCRWEGFENKEGLHDVLKDKLDLPDYYGKNLDALWDCLTGWIELPQTLVWRNFESSKKFLGSYADNTLEVLQRAQKELEDEFKIIVE
ncbi:barstar family protein [Bacillus mojavensis]|nr:barstar family protein [Bacillus mojavensis]MEC1671706.1 barstar family protein [Bacillus mojavensis]